MKNKNYNGIIFYSNGGHSAGNFKELKEFTQKLPEVGVIWESKNLPLSNPKALISEVKKNGINRMVIAGDTPGMIKTAICEAMTANGFDAKSVVLASFREYGVNGFKNSDRAKAVLYCAIKGIPFEEAAIPKDYKVASDTLVIGGGIAGIQSSLEIANAGYKVYLVERTGTIGGHMAMFDKTFPTLDCAACILTPKMVEIGQHQNIDLLTYSEIQDVSGEPGNYKVKILKKARMVDLHTCIGCGTCSEKCPGKATSEFDAGTTLRKAIYIPFPQAVPNKYLVDKEACTYIKSDGQKCGVCMKVCPVENCINLHAEDETIEINVGNIVVATGFQTFDPKRAEQFGYGIFPNVLTSLELERLINAAGPTGGYITSREQDKKKNWIFKEDGKEPASVALIHCIGSRDQNYNKYCSKVCCMYSLKLAHLVKEKIPEAEVYEYYIDMRAFGKGYEEFYERIKEEGINVIRGRTATVKQSNGKLLLRSEDMENERLVEQEVDMVVLSVGIEPRDDSFKLAQMLGLSQDEDGWFSESGYLNEPVSTYNGGIMIAGVCQGPKDIPDTVAQASAASAKVLQNISRGKMPGNLDELTFSEIETKTNELFSLKEF